MTSSAEVVKEKLPTISEKIKINNLVEGLLEVTKKSIRFLKEDFTKQHLLWVKVVFFLQSASLVTLYPYLTLHLKSLGFTIEDASLVNSVIPGADIFGPPLAGFLADKLGNFRLFMASLTFFNGASSLLLLAIPPLNNTTVNNGTMLVIGSENNWNNEEFWAYLAIRVLLDVLRASSLMLFEGAVVSIIKQHGGDYGLQKLFGTFGAVIFGPLSGLLIDFGQGHSKAYVGVIVLYFCLRTLTAIVILNLDLNFKPRGSKVLKNLGLAMCKTEVLAFLFAFLMAGIMWGYLENFLFWHLEDLGATKFLMGISLAVGTIAGVPLTMFSTLIIQGLGHRKIVVLVIVLYAIRMFGYSELTKVEVFLAFEVAKPFCTTLLLISVMTFVKDNAPLTTIATMEAIFGSTYFGVGRGLGGLFGGFSIEAFGNVQSFRIFGVVALVSAVLYSFVILLNRATKSKKYILPVV